MFKAVKSIFKNYGNFKGRARRSEYWFFVLFNFLVTFLISFLSSLLASGSNNPELSLIPSAFLGIYSLVIIIPSFSVMCRRLHDIGKSGSYIFFALIPVVGSIFLWVWTLQDGQPGPNQYGPDPKGRGQSANIGQKTPPVQQARPAIQPVQPVVQPVQPVVQPVQPVVQRTDNLATVSISSPPAYSPMGAHLCCLCEVGAIAGTRVTGSHVLIGRDVATCKMVFPGNAPGISKKHCELRAEGGGVVLTDLGSSYGTYLANGQKLSPNVPVRLNYGDYFYLASKQTVIRVMQA